jgi:hypothetical protein
MEPVTVYCSGSCTVTHVVSTSIPLLELSLEQGSQIAGAILLVWGVGFVYRVISQYLSGKTSTSESDSSS